MCCTFLFRSGRWSTHLLFEATRGGNHTWAETRASFNYTNEPCTQSNHQARFYIVLFNSIRVWHLAIHCRFSKLAKKESHQALDWVFKQTKIPTLVMKAKEDEKKTWGTLSWEVLSPMTHGGWYKDPEVHARKNHHSKPITGSRSLGHSKPVLKIPMDRVHIHIACHEHNGWKDSALTFHVPMGLGFRV